MNKVEKVIYALSARGMEKVAKQLAPSINLITFDVTVVISKREVSILLTACLDSNEYEELGDAAKERFEETIDNRVINKMEGWAKRIAKSFNISSLSEAVEKETSCDWYSRMGIMNDGNSPFTYSHCSLYIPFTINE